MIARESSKADAAATAALGDRFSRRLSPDAAFWLNLQSPYDPAMAEKRLGTKIGAKGEAT